MNFLKKYFYLIMLIVCIISFAFDFKLLQIFVIITALVIYYREYMFGNLNSYTKEQNYAAIKRVVKGFCIFMGTFAFLIISVMLFIANLKDYLIQVFFTFFLVFVVLYRVISKKKIAFIKFAEFVFVHSEKNISYFCLIASIIIVKKNLYLYDNLIIILIPIFSFLPPVISIINKDITFQKKVINYCILLMINLLFITISDKIGVQNFYFDMEQGKILFLLLSLLKLLCTSFSYFFIIQVTYLSIRFCIPSTNE